MIESPIGKSAWNLTAAFYCLSKEKDLFGPHQVENINCGFFCFSLLTLDKYFYAVYSARTLPRVTGKELIITLSAITDCRHQCEQRRQMQL